MHKCAGEQPTAQSNASYNSKGVVLLTKNTTPWATSIAKTPQKHTTWWQKIKTWHTIPLLVPTKQSLKLTFTKMARHSATCANQFVKIAVKNTPRGGKKQNCRCVCIAVCCTIKTPLAQPQQTHQKIIFHEIERGY